MKGTLRFFGNCAGQEGSADLQLLSIADVRW
jgi:hypothetical protein